MSEIHLAKDRIEWRAFVNTAMDLRIPHTAWIFITN